MLSFLFHYIVPVSGISAAVMLARSLQVVVVPCDSE